MPLTERGKRILKEMRHTYGSTEKAKQVFYAMIAEKKLKGVEGKPKSKRSKK